MDRIPYMGTKQWLADEVANVVFASSRGGVVLDLFSGMCAISEAVSPQVNVWNNDAQVFAYTYAKGWGKAGLKVEEQIHPDISWNPSFFLRSNNHLPYSSALKIAAHDVRNAPIQIIVYNIIPEDVFLEQTNQKQLSKLRADGFGLVSIDKAGATTLRHPGVPLSQHIQTEEFDRKIGPLSPRVKVCFRNAYDTYAANPAQGLQEAGQIVEALVTAIATQADGRSMCGKQLLAKTAADTIDNLYGEAAFKNHRAALGAARGFMKHYRNIVSHPAKSASQVADKMRACRDGFLQSVAIAEQLRGIFQEFHFAVRINV
jgi:hypothetical protein